MTKVCIKFAFNVIFHNSQCYCLCIVFIIFQRKQQIFNNKIIIILHFLIFQGNILLPKIKATYPKFDSRFYGRWSYNE